MASGKKSESESNQKNPSTDPREVGLILEGRHSDPFGFLGLQPSGTGKGLVIRSFQPEAKEVSAVIDGQTMAMREIHGDGFYELDFPDATERFDYTFRIVGNDGKEVATRDTYQFASTIGDQDIHYFNEGSHRRLWDMLGAHLMTCGDTAGTRFSVWAPNAWRVSVVGDFNKWDGRVNPMRNRNGVWEIFLPGIGEGAHYKFEVVGKEGEVVTKSDPHAFYSQHGIDNASMVFNLDRYSWSDDLWMKQRASKDHYHTPMAIYEVHPGSWKRKSAEKDRFLSYIEMAAELVDYVVEMGFTHIELMPVSEFPFDGSWGYQVCGYYAPTSRFGSPDEFRNFVDICHQRGIGVIMDWVPAHFPKDAHGLARFDGTALYEHEDPRQGEHEDWGTLIYNYGRNEVKNFLVANALYWLKEYHIDGIRVDAVASMLYLDYSREEGQWIPNEYGGRENLGAIEFLKNLNAACYEECPGVMTIAEESTSFPGVSRPIDQGGLGFGFKWNMGWMNDSLHYMSKEPIYRKFHHNEATFSLIYAYNENYVLVLSHDEVVHGKGSMINKMPGDRWQKFANLRMFYGWMYAHPGKKLLFQSNEIAQPAEWNYNKSVDWQLLKESDHSGIRRLVKDLNHLYISEPALYHFDHEQEGFEWIMQDDAENSVFAFFRKGGSDECVVVLVNATPVVRNDYRIGVPSSGFYEEIFNSDAELYGGSNLGNAGGIPSESQPSHGRENSIVIQLPPLSTVFFKLRQV